MERILKFIVAMQVRLNEMSDKERGATATEYALLVALIAVVIVIGVAFFGTALSNFFSTLGNKVTAWGSSI